MIRLGPVVHTVYIISNCDGFEHPNCSMFGGALSQFTGLLYVPLDHRYAQKNSTYSPVTVRVTSMAPSESNSEFDLPLFLLDDSLSFPRVYQLTTLQSVPQSLEAQLCVLTPCPVWALGLFPYHPDFLSPRQPRHRQNPRHGDQNKKLLPAPVPSADRSMKSEKLGTFRMEALPAQVRHERKVPHGLLRACELNLKQMAGPRRPQELSGEMCMASGTFQSHGTSRRDPSFQDMAKSQTSLTQRPRPKECWQLIKRTMGKDNQDGRHRTRAFRCL